MLLIHNLQISIAWFSVDDFTVYMYVHCKIKIFFNLTYGIFFHPFKNIFPKVRKNYSQMTEIAIWKLKKFQKRWNLTHFQNSEIFFTNLWRIISAFLEFDERNYKDMELISFNYRRKFRKVGNVVSRKNISHF